MIPFCEYFVATMFGLGSYFAKKSATSASDTYSKPNSDGQKYMIQARVVTGEWCKGEKDMKTPPYKDQSSDQYDSVVDDVSNPSIFVVFRDASAYPEYIIKFKAVD